MLRNKSNRKAPVRVPAQITFRKMAPSPAEDHARIARSDVKRHAARR